MGSIGTGALHDPQTLYSRWEHAQWNPFAIDLRHDAEQWASVEERGLIEFVVGSLMVAEERITTTFSGLVGAHASEEEAAFLATQQVDEARHMQFYARFQNEVVASPAAIAEHVLRARAHVSGAFRTLFDDRLGAAHERLVADPADIEAKVAFVTIYHQVLEGTLGLTTFEFATRMLERQALFPGFREGYARIHHDEHRHIAYGTWFLQQAVAADPPLAGVVRATLVDLLPAVADSLQIPDGADATALGAGTDDLRAFALSGLTRRLKIIGVPIETVFGGPRA